MSALAPRARGALDSITRARSSRRQRLVAHLHASGPRPVLEALLELEAGRGLDEVLERYGRIPAAIYHALGADVLPIDVVVIIDGGRS
jgi:hypothetical protein